ncbi:E3 ubiquitin-protein ligase MIB2 isoform X3 [Spea bombifrons]|uniref:E3 ubiquitin-protein ligase MIB2 isoform X3 n=1 Tax=Spea bombifrons TaxID=233779 RepID=UPI0023491515|nr:E3 ubiquitin-protein ligase MIB2 isoform X3 [Spea bombifrons]
MDCDPSANMQVGMRVVRGVDWKWANQDNGEGSVGTVVEIGRQGSPTTPDKTVVVQWDHGTRTNYRAGFQGAYDLLLYDNAQIGVRHPNIICDCCKKHGIRGMRWKCKVCFDYDLCTQCYMNNKHDLAHAFERYETAHSRPVILGPRQGLQRAMLKGIFQGAKVVRGPDWEWGNQDGGEGKLGRVVDIRGWDVETGRSVASVTWADGTTNVYRVGHKGKVDLKSITEASGGHYYRDHLPKLGPFHLSLGKPAEIQRKESSERHPFQHGDKVKCLLDVEILREMQEGHGGWNPKMAEFIGQTGTVHRITERGDVRVQYNSETRWTFHPGALTKHNSIWVGDVVRVMDCMDTVKKLQVDHGEWTDDMAPALGQIGKVIKVFGDGDMRVSVGGQSWTFNPACLTAYQQEEDANLMTTENAKEPKKKLLAQKSDCESPSSLVIEAAHGNAAKVREILQKHPDKVDVRNQGRTALQVAAHLGFIEVVKILLQANANIDLKDDEGDSALHYAAYGNQAAVVRVLLGKGADTELLNNTKFTALYIAVNKGFTEVVQALCVPNSSINIQDSRGDTALHCAITADFRSIIEILTEVPNIDFTVQNNQGFNLLHHAALKGNVLAVKKILERARQLVDSKKEDGFTALHLAALNNHREVVEILIKEGRCDVNLRNNRNQSPLHLAVTQGHVSLVHLLLTEDADVNAEDEDGDTPMHVVITRQHLESIELEQDGDGSALLAKLQASGLLGNVEMNAGTAMACFLAQSGADINYANHRGKSPMDLIKDGRIAHLVKAFSQKYREHLTESGSSTITCSLRRVHTTPNTVTNLSLPCAASPSECLVCSEMAVLINFFPCQHSIVCEECSRRMKKCIKCQVSITKKVRQDSTEVDSFPSLDTSDQRKIMEELQNRYRQMEERMTCPVCIDSYINLVFQCGHGSCADCSISLSTCPICRQGIKDRIQLFV